MTTKGFRRCLNCGTLFKPHKNTVHPYCSKPECKEVQRKGYQERFRERHGIKRRDNTVACLNCGKVCEYDKLKAGPKPKYFYCDNPACQDAALEAQRVRDKRAGDKYRERVANGQHTKERDIIETRYKCSNCGRMIYYWREYGQWIKPRMVCKECQEDADGAWNHFRQDKRAQPRMDVDYLYA